jgi:DNA polymerase I
MTQTLWQDEADFIRLMARIKQRGIKIDTAFSRAKVIEGTRELNRIQSKLGWNPGSPKQLGEYLLDELNLPVVSTTPAGKPSFDKAALEEYEFYLAATGNETAQEVLKYRGWQKTVSSNYQAYLDLMDENEILHPNYKVHGTRSGRLSCEKPNLQQIPRSNPKPWNGDVKKAFIVRHPGLLHYSFDFKQVEFRLAAAYAKEEELLEIFNSGADIFTEMASRLCRPRHKVKTFVYSTLYGAGRKKVALVLGMPQDESDEFYDEYHGTWPGFRTIANKATEVCRGNGGYIEYWTGRRSHLHFGESHKAFNRLIQGGAFEIVKQRMLALREEPIVLQVHDSITCEADNSYDTDRIKRVMEAVPQAREFGVKFEVDLTIEGAKLN